MRKKLSAIVVFLILFFSENILAQVYFSTGKIFVRVDDFAAIRIYSIDGSDTVQQLNRVSLLVAGDTNQVWDYWNDVDIVSVSDTADTAFFGDYELKGEYNNGYSNLPPKVIVDQSIFGWNDEGYCIIKATITNKQDSTIPSIVGLDVVQYMDSTWENDNIYFDNTNNMLVQYEKHYAAVKILSEETTSAQVFDWYKEYSVDSNYYNWITNKSFDTEPLTTNEDGGVAILAGELQNLKSDQFKTIYFTIAVGGSEQEMQNNIQAADQRFSVITNVESNGLNVPLNFTLYQNYPNPFNPSTTINYSIPSKSVMLNLPDRQAGSFQHLNNSGIPKQVQNDNANVTLKIYDILGREAAILVNQKQKPGNYKVEWNASEFSSGIYFYQLSTENLQQTRKMILLK